MHFYIEHPFSDTAAFMVFAEEIEQAIQTTKEYLNKYYANTFNPVSHA